ncbi:MAG TPA: pyridoxal-phosphate dependent enzyme [Rhodothermales bacterium]|nr:pyridoxal-phosphate dependent enzyme [Rhodothermales bacterium]
MKPPENPKGESLPFLDVNAGRTAARISAESPGALDRIRPYILSTPVQTSRTLSQEAGSRVLLKCEHRQTTGSFKLRGALNKVLSLSRQCLDEGVVVASTGNHGSAVAYACRLLGGKCTVFVPKDVSRMKERAMRDLGAEVRRQGADGLEAERAARHWASENTLEYISPYNDIDVIIGQATLGRELLEYADSGCDVYVAVGGGGLVSGLAAVLKHFNAGIRIVGCSPANHPVMDESVRAGRIVDLPYRPTLSDGTAGRLESDSLTLPLCAHLVDDWIRVSEAEIVESLRLLGRQEHMIVEGAAAVAVAGLRKDSNRRTGDKIVVLCGGNVDKAVMADILAQNE